jgi:hypothetical protein
MTKRDDVKMINLLNICILIDFVTVTVSEKFCFCVRFSNTQYQR